jgi:hypothetical protein
LSDSRAFLTLRPNVPDQECTWRQGNKLIKLTN